MDHNPHLHDELVVPGDAHVEDADVYCGAQVIDVGHEAVGLPLERKIYFFQNGYIQYTCRQSLIT